LITLALLLLGGAGFIAVKLVGKKMLVQHLATSEDAYARGLAYFDAKDFASATKDFEEAIREAATGIQELDKRPKAQTVEMSSEELRARLVWVYVRAVRDRAYAKAELAEKPLLTDYDTTFKVQRRSLLNLPDAAERNRLGQLLRRVATILPKDEAVQQECLRVELILARTEWALVKQLCDNIVELAPAEPRARFLLAYYEYEQPSRENVLTPDNKRDLHRALKALEHLAKARDAKIYPVWRTIGLEARALHWVLSQPTKDLKDVNVAKLKTRLKEILTDDKTGLPAFASQPESLASLTRFDTRGMTDLFTLAVEHTAAEPNGPVATTLHRFVTTINAIPDKNIDPAQLGDLTDAALSSITKYADLAKMRESVAWGQTLDVLDEAGKRLVLHKQLSPKRSSTLSEIYNFEGKARYPQAIAWALEGLKLDAGDEYKTDLHLLCMNLKSAEGRPIAEIRPHAEALRESSSRKGQAIAGYFEATTAIDAGKCDHARKWLEEVVRRPEGGDLVIRSYVILPDLYMALSRPIEAAAYARELDRGYERVANASRGLQVWASDYYRSHQDVVAAVVVTQYEAARLKVERERREHPERADQPLPVDFTKTYEDEAQRALVRLVAKSPANMLARVAKCEFLALARPDEFKKEMDALRNEYPASPAVLRVEFATVDSTTKPALENRVKKLAEDTDYAGLWAEWLFRTERSAEALSYLETHAAPELNALAAFLKRLPNRDAIIDATYCRAFVKDPAAPHHERLAVQQIKQALANFATNQPLEAGQALRRVAEHARFRPAVREGLKVAVADLTKSQPDVAKKYASEWLP
jgi:hypothetical protein